jgi:hypothetical protein
MVEVHAAVGELGEGPLLLLLHFHHLPWVPWKSH